MPLSQSARDAKRDTTLVRISRALLDLMRDDAHKKRATIREVMEAVLRRSFKAPK